MNVHFDLYIVLFRPYINENLQIYVEKRLISKFYHLGHKSKV